MKKKFVVLFVIVVAVLALTACTSQFQQRVVTMPEEGALVIQTFVTLAVGWVFAQIATRFPWFSDTFGHYAPDVSFAISSAILIALQSWLNLIPAGWEDVGNIGIRLIIAILVALKVYKTARAANVKTFRTFAAPAAE